MAKTNIFHTDFEHDKYITPRFYMLGDVMFDHNYSQGLNFQQIYGVGAGYTVIQTPIHQFDVKGDIHYERQNFIQFPPPLVSSANQNLIGSTFAEAYKRILPGKILFTESGTLHPILEQHRSMVGHRSLRSRASRLPPLLAQRELPRQLPEQSGLRLQEEQHAVRHRRNLHAPLNPNAAKAKGLELSSSRPFAFCLKSLHCP